MFSKLKNCISNFFRCFRANYFIQRLCGQNNKSRRIRICFIVQMPEIWDKESPVFDLMIKDDRFDAELFVIPSYDLTLGKINEYGFELDYFINKYGEDLVKRAYKNGAWVDLKSCGYDYVFYQRCWENYIPEIYHTKNVIKYSRTCYIPYAVGLKDGKNYYRTDFFAYLYMSFCSTKEQVDFYDKKINNKVIYCGYPIIEKIYKSISEVNTSNSSNNSKTILWTPRWTDDPFFGGSTFFKYMNNILEIKRHHDNANLILRPHPLTFSYAIKEGKLSEDKVVEYKRNVESCNSSFDTNVFIEDTLINTDILITDYSSIVLDYYITGRPIIYCTDINIDFENIFKIMTKTFYLAKNWDDVSRIVNDLMNGYDPLYYERKKVVDEIINDNINASENILNYIISDFRK